MADTNNEFFSIRKDSSLIVIYLFRHRDTAVSVDFTQAVQKASDREDREDVVFLMQRVAALERDLVKIQSMWDMNKGQRVIEVWMSILNKKSYKPSNM